MWLARRFGRPLVERYVDPQLMVRLDDMVERYGMVFIFLVFLLPFLPDDALCLLAGLTTFPLGSIIFTGIGRANTRCFCCQLAGFRGKILNRLAMGNCRCVITDRRFLVWRYRKILPGKILSFVENMSKRFSGGEDPGQ